MAEKYDALEHKFTKELEMKQELSATQGENDSTYFRVTLTRRITVSSGSNVKFDKIDVNVGGCYSIHSGTYLCLVPGLYMFNVHLQLDDTAAWFALKKNSEVLAHLHVNKGRRWIRDSTSVPVWCNQGDEVYLVVTSGTASKWLGNHTYFSGALIHT